MRPKKITTPIDLVTYSKGGVIPILNRIKSVKIPQIINKVLGKRPNQAKYSHDEILLSWIMTQFCFGSRLLKMSTQAIPAFEGIKQLHTCSHDTINRFMKSLATPVEMKMNVNKKHSKNEEHALFKANGNEKMAELLIQLSKAIGSLSETEEYVLDCDCVILESGVHDSLRTYKGFNGFSVMTCMIGKVIVYMRMNGGNAGPYFDKLECLQECLSLMKKHNIKIKTVRIDGAGFSKHVTEYLDSNGYKFIIGAKWSNKIYETVSDKKVEWHRKKITTTEHSWDAEVARTHFSFYKSHDNYHLCALRVKEYERETDEEKPMKWKYEDGYYYKTHITNDHHLLPAKAISMYMDRGGIERTFSYLNDTGWAILPFSHLNENHVYLYITAITNNIFEGLKAYFEPLINRKEFNTTIMLEKFRQIFINITFMIIGGKYIFSKTDGKEVLFKNLV